MPKADREKFSFRSLEVAIVGLSLIQLIEVLYSVVTVCKDLDSYDDMFLILPIILIVLILAIAILILAIFKRCHNYILPWLVIVVVRAFYILASVFANDSQNVWNNLTSKDMAVTFFALLYSIFMWPIVLHYYLRMRKDSNRAGYNIPDRNRVEYYS